MQRSAIGHHSAFTLTELLIVIAIMILLLSVAVPSVSKLLNAGREDAALGTFGAAIATVRPYANTNPWMPTGAAYQGVALIVTPANELRVVQHRLDAPVANPTYHCYQDVPREGYVRLPKGVGLVGIARHTAGAPHLLAPPFALRFDPNGHLRVDGTHGPPTAYSRNAGPGHVFYDGDYDGYWGENGRWPGVGGTHPRDNDYDPRDWDPEFAGKTVGTSAQGKDHNKPVAIFHENEQKYMLPFDAIETVIGVIAFNKQSLYDQFGVEALKARPGPGAENLGNLAPDVRDWLFENGDVMFFNRYSGAVIKP